MELIGKSSIALRALMLFSPSELGEKGGSVVMTSPSFTVCRDIRSDASSVDLQSRQ